MGISNKPEKNSFSLFKGCIMPVWLSDENGQGTNAAQFCSDKFFERKKRVNLSTICLCRCRQHYVFQYAAKSDKCFFCTCFGGGCQEDVNGEKLTVKNGGFLAPIFSRFGADFFTVYADFSRFIRDINGEKKKKKNIIFTVSFSRFAPSRGCPHLHENVFLCYVGLVVCFV